MFSPNAFVSTGITARREFIGRALALNTAWDVWQKEAWMSWVHILAIGPGGNGGNGAVGANSAAAGGGGGASGGQSSLLIPAEWLPDVLHICGGVAGTNHLTRVAAFPDTTAINQIVIANAGGVGGNAAGATAGAAGSAAAAATIAGMPLAGMGTFNLLAGQAGIIGGVAVSGLALTLPVTGLRVTGGTGGGGLPAAAVIGTNGGLITGSGLISSIPGGIGGSAATVPAIGGGMGRQYSPRIPFYTGGSGGGSTHGTPTGAGLAAGLGGNGAPGCGGGGGGGGFTGSAQGIGGRGGSALVIITAY